MMLYHFTRPENVPSIRERGLVPAPYDHDDTGGQDVVWLTSLPDLRFTAEERTLCLAHHGIAYDEWLTDGPFVRLTVGPLDPRDPLLVEWTPWARKHDIEQDDPLSRGRIGRSIWFYTGRIAPSMITFDARVLPMSEPTYD
jgi:hypothetical protein